jgi:hypothetical protein
MMTDSTREETSKCAAPALKRIIVKSVIIFSLLETASASLIMFSHASTGYLLRTPLEFWSIEYSCKERQNEERSKPETKDQRSEPDQEIECFEHILPPLCQLLHALTA